MGLAGLGGTYCEACADRLEKKITPFNFHLRLGNVSLVGVDSVSMALNPRPLNPVF